MRTDRLQREHGVELRWTVFPLHPETPEEGLELTDLLGRREDEVAAMQDRLLKLAEDEGLPMAKRTHTYNSRLAQELGKWAESQGMLDAYRPAVYRAFFVKGRNIAQMDELLWIAESVGLSKNEAREVLETGSYSEAVEADWQRAGDLGVTAVPTHLCGRKRLVGFSPYQDFLRLIGKE